MKHWLSNLVVLMVTGAIGLVLCEVGIRLIVSPSDFLSVEMVSDDVLGAVPSGGFDEWGFRNSDVPDSADIVAIGDSHTYGNTATMNEAWPAALAALTGNRVYNMGMGGYGPNQYRHLLETRALQLDPETIVVGLYIGDDFENAFLITYGLSHWGRLRTLPAERVDFDIWQEPVTPSWHKKIRVWLSSNSVIYQLVVHGLLGRLKGEVQIKNAPTEAVTTLSIPEKNLLEAFRPMNMLRILDQDSPSVLEGMRITFELLREMRELAVERGIDFRVLLIPTKEMVFADYLENRADLTLSDTIDRLLANERQAREKTAAFLDSASIPYIDALPFLREARDAGIYAKSSEDMHPNGRGYRVIADAVYASLRAERAGDDSAPSVAPTGRSRDGP